MGGPLWARAVAAAAALASCASCVELSGRRWQRAEAEEGGAALSLPPELVDAWVGDPRVAALCVTGAVGASEGSDEAASDRFGLACHSLAEGVADQLRKYDVLYTRLLARAPLDDLPWVLST